MPEFGDIAASLAEFEAAQAYFIPGPDQPPVSVLVRCFAGRRNTVRLMIEDGQDVQAQLIVTADALQKMLSEPQ